MPPYDDQAISLWTEANFLATTNFDFYRLRYQELHVEESRLEPERIGQRTYMISVLPSLLAMLMLWLPSTQAVLITTHLLNLACASTLAILMLATLRHVVGWWGAILTVAALLSTPLFRVQIDMVGLDMSMATCAMFAAVLAWRGAFRAAAVMAGLAFLMKATGGLVTVALIIYLLLLKWAPSGRGGGRRNPRIGRGLAWSGAMLLGELVLFVWADPLPLLGGRGDRITENPVFFKLPYALLLQPDVAVLLFVAALLTGWHVWRERPRPAHTLPLTSRLSTWVDQIVGQEPILLLSWLIILGSLAAMRFWIVLPRYFTCMLPFLFLVLGISLQRGLRLRRVAPLILLGLLGFNLSNAEGRFDPSIPRLLADFCQRDAYATPRNCAFLERSLEYLPEHRANIALTRLVAERYADQPLLVPVPFLNYFTEPRLGFVPHQIETYHAGNFAIALLRFRDLTAEAISTGSDRFPILIWDRNSRLNLPPPDLEHDEILFRYDGTPPLLMYRKRLPAGVRTTEQIQSWYLDATWPGPWLAQRALARTPWLCENGLTDRCRSELQTAWLQDPNCFVGERWLLKVFLEGVATDAQWRAEVMYPFAQNAASPPDCRLAIALRRLDGPVNLELISSRVAPDRPESERLYSQAVSLLEKGDRKSSARTFAEALDHNLSSQRAPLAQLAIGRILIEEGNLPEAEAALQRALDLQKALPAAHYYLGLLYLKQDRLVEARQQLQAAIALAPDWPAPRSQLDGVSARLRESGEISPAQTGRDATGASSM